MDQILNTILKDTYTLTQLKHRFKILKSYLEKTLFGGELEEALAKEDLDFLKTLPDDLFRQFNKDNAYSVFTGLENKINQLIPLTIYLPFTADEEVMAQIGSSARTTLQNPHLILDSKYDPLLIAGCALSWKGIYKDYSLKARIEEKKGEVLEGFKKFLR